VDKAEEKQQHKIKQNKNPDFYINTGIVLLIGNLV